MESFGYGTAKPSVILCKASELEVAKAVLADADNARHWAKADTPPSEVDEIMEMVKDYATFIEGHPRAKEVFEAIRARLQARLSGTTLEASGE